MSKKNNLNRRRFLQTSGAIAVSAGILSNVSFPAPAFAKVRNPNGKLSVGLVGIASRGEAQVHGLGGENVVGLCDIDDNYLSQVGEKFPDAKKYNDYRIMYDELGDKIDAVAVSTTDHIHAPASVNAMRRGLHCYCEKPLAHTVQEVRVMTDLAKEKKLFTQMGTQIHAEPNYRRVVELVKSGAIGKVKEVHVWCGTGWGGHSMPTEFPEVPKNIHWDLWLGPVPFRKYSPKYFGGNWRSYWAFGSGSLGDMGCHHIDLSYWALDLKYPTSVVSTASSKPDPECTPLDMVAKYEFPARGDQPPVTLTWYDGKERPPIIAEKGLPNDWGAGTLFVGEDGKMIMADYGRHLLLPENKFGDFKRPEKTIPDSIGHYEEWIQAIKTGEKPALCDFSYSGPIAEMVLLGTVSYRLGKKINWDAANLKAVGDPDADKFLKKEYPKDWSIF